MMKLMLMRHGEAEGSPDIERQLTERGRRESRQVGNMLRQMGQTPDIILCSGVLRTRETLACLDFIGIPVTDCHLGLYRAESVQEILDIIADYTASYHEKVLVIGHNPWIHETVRYLGAKKPNHYFYQVAHHYAPSTLSLINYAGVDWGRINPQACEITGVLTGASDHAATEL